MLLEVAGEAASLFGLLDPVITHRKTKMIYGNEGIHQAIKICFALCYGETQEIK